MTNNEKEIEKDIIKIGTEYLDFDKKFEKNPKKARKKIEPWLSAAFQSEHLNLLLGSGFSIGMNKIAGIDAQGMDIQSIPVSYKYKDKIEKKIEESVNELKRGNTNIEDQIRVILEILPGIKLIDERTGTKYKKWLEKAYLDFLKGLLKSEYDFSKKTTTQKEHVDNALTYLKSFLLSFASRIATRERLHIFTTNYTRLIEHGCDLLGIRIIDRFIGNLNPIFRTSQLDVDMHYNPPGIRGEPRYLEGIIKFTKLHGSLDWFYESENIYKKGIGFGEIELYDKLFKDPLSKVMIYPNPAKDIETLLYPYAALFRDFSTAISRPNSTLVTYGYGFGDSHINKIIKDMLKLPSTHLIIISFDDPGNRIKNFYEDINQAQLTLLIGKNVGNISNLVKYFLPKASIDNITYKMMELTKNRPTEDNDKEDDVSDLFSCKQTNGEQECHQ